MKVRYIDETGIPKTVVINERKIESFDILDGIAYVEVRTVDPKRNELYCGKVVSK